MRLDDFSIPGMNFISIFLRVAMDISTIKDEEIDEHRNSWPQIKDDETPLFEIQGHELRALAALQIIKFKNLTSLQTDLKLRHEPPTPEIHELKSYVEVLQNLFYYELRNQHPELWGKDFGIRSGYVVVKIDNIDNSTLKLIQRIFGDID